MSTGPYLALIGDVVASRQREDRQALQETLLAAVAELNERLGPALAAPLTLTAGDEIQGLFGEPEGAVLAIQELTDRAGGTGEFPPVAFGVGWGSLTTGPLPSPPAPPANPAYLDGPCFHAARDAQERARKARVWARFAGVEPWRAQALDALFDLMGAIRADWTANQGQNTHAMRRYTHQKDWAAAQGVQPSAISESLKAAHWEAILAGEAAARELIREPGDAIDPTRLVCP